jgi:hypothetical protein
MERCIQLECFFRKLWRITEPYTFIWRPLLNGLHFLWTPALCWLIAEADEPPPVLSSFRC